MWLSNVLVHYVLKTGKLYNFEHFNSSYFSSVCKYELLGNVTMIWFFSEKYKREARIKIRPFESEHEELSGDLKMTRSSICLEVFI